MHKLFWVSTFASLSLTCMGGVALAASTDADAAASLRAKYASLQEPLRQNQFKRPLVLYATETQNRLTGDIYAIVDYPYNTVSAGLSDPDHWCDVMILHINTKYCHAVSAPSGTMLNVNMGKKTPQELAHAARVEFKYDVGTLTPEYFEILLNAQAGPFGTSDFRIGLEAVALPNGKTFLHLSYSYAMSFAARMALKTYLATIGSNKVGFTVIGRRADGQTDYLRGVRGLMERNTMRYYLAIDAFLGAATRVAPAAQLEHRLQNWFTSVEQYPRQLHEMDRGEYLAMKRAEYLRQQTVQ